MIIQSHKPVWVEVDLANLRYNIKQVRKILNPGTKFLGVVKSNAYGHGIIKIGRTCAEEKADILGVFSVDEGIYLRENGIRLPVLLFGIVYPYDSFNEVIKYDLIPPIGSIEELKYLNKYAFKKNICKGFHMKVDTGMARIGVAPDKIGNFLCELDKCKNVRLSGVFTHFSSAFNDKEYTLFQIKRFNRVISELKQAGYSKILAHAANSATTLRFPEARYSIVRPGSTMYGLLPFDNADKYLDVRPVLEWKTKIVFLKKVPAGTSISYGRTFVTRKPSVIATLPVGYGDGYDRRLSNVGYVIVKNKKSSIIGTVCMNMIMVDVTNIKNVKIGDEVILIGSSGNERISAEDMTRLLNTINLEVVSSISPEVPRTYIN